MAAKTSSLSFLFLASRIGAAVFGGYAFTWGLMALGITVLFAAGMEFHDAEHLGAIVGFLVYLSAFLWAFSSPSLARIWLLLVGTGALTTVAASLMQLRLVE